MIIIKTEEQIAKMRDAGKIVAEVLALLEEQVRPGISTYELDQIAEKHILAANAVPTFKGYGGFPAAICASINEEVVHGIPRPDRVLHEGILSVWMWAPPSAAMWVTRLGPFLWAILPQRTLGSLR